MSSIKVKQFRFDEWKLGKGFLSYIMGLDYKFEI
jgi:hypothetical protein